MRLEELQVHLSKHAYQQYCDRVAQISKDELERACAEHLAAGDYEREAEYVAMGGVWWVIDTVGEQLTLVTCYGRLNLDLPAALRWARVHKDRIALGHFDGSRISQAP